MVTSRAVRPAALSRSCFTILQQMIVKGDVQPERQGPRIPPRGGGPFSCPAKHDLPRDRQESIEESPTAWLESVDDVFIAAITKQGIQPPSSKEAVGEAHNVCALLDGGAGLADTIDAVAE